jgi:hypothetical protein
MTAFTPDQWLIIILVFLAGLFIGMALLAGGKWKRRYREEAARREALERENAQMRSENAELRSKVATLESSDAHGDEIAALRDLDARQGGKPAPEFLEPEEEERMSKRRMLSRAGAAVAGLVVAGALTQRDIREAKANPTSFTTETADRGAVEGTNTSSGYGVWGNSAFWGVYGLGTFIGVKGSLPISASTASPPMTG